MDLKEFISQTLGQIVAGVKAAQEEARNNGATINPRVRAPWAELSSQGLISGEGDLVAQVVQFDVALTVMEGTGTKGGIGVFAGAVTLGSSGQSKAESSSVSRVKFAVPLLLPGGKVT